MAAMGFMPCFFWQPCETARVSSRVEMNVVFQKSLEKDTFTYRRGTDKRPTYGELDLPEMYEDDLRKVPVFGVCSEFGLFVAASQAPAA